MKTLASSLLLLFLGCVTTGRPGPQAFEREASDATVLLISLQGSFGSGVVVAQDDQRALILTANHVVRDRSAEEFTIEQRSPRYKAIQLPPCSGSKVVKRNLQLDLVLIETKPIWPRVAKVASLADLESDVVPYAECFVFGYPITGDAPPPAVHMTSGWITSMVPGGRMGISAPIVFGNSGGGVWVQAGGRLTLVGVVHSMFAVQGNFIYHHGRATRTTDMIEFLRLSE